VLFVGPSECPLWVSCRVRSRNWVIQSLRHVQSGKGTDSHTQGLKRSRWRSSRTCCAPPPGFDFILTNRIARHTLQRLPSTPAEETTAMHPSTTWRQLRSSRQNYVHDRHRQRGLKERVTVNVLRFAEEHMDYAPFFNNVGTRTVALPNV